MTDVEETGTPVKAINLTSGNSDDTLYDEAEGAEEDDLVESTPGSKKDHLYQKLEIFISKRFGKKGSDTRPTVSVEELLKHSTLEDFWVVVDDKVFDIGPFLRGEAKHPGGKSILQRQLELGGTTPHDAMERFVRWHHPGGNAVRRAPENFVGDLLGGLPDHMRAKKTLRQRLCGCRRRDD